MFFIYNLHYYCYSHYKCILLFKSLGSVSFFFFFFFLFFKKFVLLFHKDANDQNDYKHIYNVANHFCVK